MSHGYEQNVPIRTQSPLPSLLLNFDHYWLNRWPLTITVMLVIQDLEIKVTHAAETAICEPSTPDCEATRDRIDHYCLFSLR